MGAWALRAERRRRSRGPRAGATPLTRRAAAAAAGRRGARAPRSDPPPGLTYINPGAAAPLAKVTGMIVTVRMRLRAAGGCKAPPSRPAQRKFCGV